MIRARVSSPVVLGFAFAISLPNSSESQLLHCDVLRTSDRAYAGRCVRQFGDSATFALLVLQAPPSGNMGRWRGTSARVFGEGRDSTKDVVDWTAFSPVFVDVHSADSLFSYCWCRITRATLDTEGLHFDADGGQEGPMTAQDLEVLRVARNYFTTSSTWNRRDSRSRGISYCQPDPPSRTLFCALYDATIAVRGEFYIFTPANGAVRDAIARSSPRNYQHPLTGFNNDALIDFDALTGMLDDAIRRAQEALAKSRGRF
jgi:hypothetical protein